MDIELYFPFDKIVAFGSIEIKGEKPSYVRDLLDKYLDKVVIRKGSDGFTASLNSNTHIKITKITESNAKNKRQRIYQLLGTREPDVIDMVMKRVLIEECSSIGVGARVTKIWLEISKTGHYCEHIEDKNFALDMLISEGLLEYDDYGYYSLSNKFIKKVQKDNSLTLSKIKKIGIPLNSLRDTINAMSQLGYFFVEDKLKFVLKSQEHTDIELLDDFMIGATL